MLKYVIKNDGRVEDFDPEKLNKLGGYATKRGGNWSEIVLESYKRLPETAKSSDILNMMIARCLDRENITYSRVAARLEYAALAKGMERAVGVKNSDKFETIFKTFVAKGLWDAKSFPEYNSIWEKVWDEVKTERLEYWQLAQWGDKYSIRKDGEAIETPHVGAMGIALGLLGDTQEAYEQALDIIQGKTNMPTPALNGIRNGDYDTISCCVISGGDSLPSIAVAQHIAEMYTGKKSGIGIEFSVREKGADVKGGKVKHLGMHPIYKHTDSAVKEFTQVTRGGNATVTYKVIDPDVQDIALWKTQRVDLEHRIDKLDYSFAYNDAFVDAVVKKEDWYLFGMTEAPEIHEAFYTHNVDEYKALVEKVLSEGKKATKVKAISLLKTLLTARNETGRVYSFNVTRANTHTPFKETIRLSNLCVAPETLILTDEGYVEISELEDQAVNVWNGEEFSETVVKKTSESSELVKVVTENGFEVECTPYHRFFTKPSYAKSKTTEVRAIDLKPGMKLIKLETPVIEGEKFLKDAYDNGFFSGDGCEYGGRQVTYLYHGKQELIPYFSGYYGLTEDPKQNRTLLKYKGLKPKYFVPMTEYTVESRLDWFAGLLDSDGCLTDNAGAQNLQIVSTKQGFLEKVQLMLQTLGVQCKVNFHTEGGMKPLPKNDGSGESKDYLCQPGVRMLINSTGISQLVSLGLEAHRLKPTGRLGNRDASGFVKVKEVVWTGRKDATYCFTEPKRGMGVFNGILAGNCQEISLVTKPYEDMFDLYVKDVSKGETAFCALSAKNVSKVKPEDYERHAYTSLRAVDAMIDKAPALTPSMKESMLRRRSVGIGITGLADFLYSRGLDYDGSDASLETCQDVAEAHYFYLLKASQQMAEEDGVVVEGVDFDWLPIDTRVNKYPLKLDWEPLRGKPRKHSVLVAHMPCESSSLFSSGANGLYAPRTKVIGKKSRKGIVQYICEGFEGKKSAWDIDNITMARYYSIFQDFADQGISADYYFDPAQYADEKKPLSELMREWVAQAKLGNKSQYYMNTRDYNGGGIHEQKDEEEGCESCKL